MRARCLMVAGPITCSVIAMGVAWPSWKRSAAVSTLPRPPNKPSVTPNWPRCRTSSSPTGARSGFGTINAKLILERDYQFECIETLCAQVIQGRRKLLVEMATGTGKTRTAAALIKRLFEANAVSRVLFLVDRITLANQTEEAFTEFLPELPCYVLRSGRRFDDARRITITTLQSMVNIYRDYSSGYFDLVISDECHRSIYGKWSG